MSCRSNSFFHEGFQNENIASVDSFSQTRPTRRARSPCDGSPRIARERLVERGAHHREDVRRKAPVRKAGRTGMGARRLGNRQRALWVAWHAYG